ncbi:hypothetical protein Hanom_Chr15g01381991 [Helianthus anomalus]
MVNGSTRCVSVQSRVQISIWSCSVQTGHSQCFGSTRSTWSTQRVDSVNSVDPVNSVNNSTQKLVKVLRRDLFRYFYNLCHVKTSSNRQDDELFVILTWF